VALSGRILHQKERLERRADAAAHQGPIASRHPRSPALTVARVCLDGFTLSVAVALAFILRFRWRVLESTTAPLDLWAHLLTSTLWLLAVVGALASYRLYDEDTLTQEGREMIRIARSVLQGVGLISTVVFLLRLVTVSRGWFLLVCLLSLALLAGERRLVRNVLRQLRARGRLRRPAILVSKHAAHPSPVPPGEPGLAEFDVVASVRPEDLPNLLASRSGTAPIVRGSAPVIIVEGDPEHIKEDLWGLVMDAGDAGCSVFVGSPFRPLPADRLSTRTLGQRTIVKVSPPALTGLRAFEKRVFDGFATFLLLLLCAVPMALIALAIFVTAGRPVFYRQQRVGKNGRLFAMWKFRTMAVDAEANTGPVWATVSDPRRTPVGRFLRRFSLDELPQLWNVLRGHMSIVGPRPERPVFVAQFNDTHPWYRFRHRIRPGITGLAQARGLRGDTPLEPRLELDNWYIEHWSLWLDVRIAARTALEVLSGRHGQ
jgi:exopolysaccharide biosynthesis polyprenyl glycosylphosphotransferase